jgi:hypothetical protein
MPWRFGSGRSYGLRVPRNSAGHRERARRGNHVKTGKLATDANVPHAVRPVNLFHIVKAANEAIDKGRRWAWNQVRPLRPHAPRSRRSPAANVRATPQPDPWVRHTLRALLKDPDDLKASQRVSSVNCAVTGQRCIALGG